MNFGHAVTILLAVCVFVLAATMANLLARITVLEQRLRDAAPTDSGQLLRWSELSKHVHDLVDPVGGGLLVFISRDCVACDDVVDQLSAWPQEKRKRSRLVFWGQPRPDFVAPAGVRILADGSDVYTELGVSRTPWYVEVADGEISGQGLGLPAHRAAPDLMRRGQP